MQLHDAYLSVAEALKHGGIVNRCSVNIRWVDSEQVTEETAEALLGGADGILVPGGFGTRGIDGKIQAIRYARTRGVPFLGICLGMQLAVIEFARDVIGYEDADSTELNPDTAHPVIALPAGAERGDGSVGHAAAGRLPLRAGGGIPGGGPLRCPGDRGAPPATATSSTMSTGRFSAPCGMRLSGLSPDGRIVEMVELPEHPIFHRHQGHPEFKSRPNHAHPLFTGLVRAAAERKRCQRGR